MTADPDQINSPIDLSAYAAGLEQADLLRWRGVITDVTGFVIESQGPAARIGSFCEIQTSRSRVIRTQVAGFRNGRILSIPLEEIDGLQPGDPIYARPQDSQLSVGPGLLGRVLDGFGRPIDGGRTDRRARLLRSLCDSTGSARARARGNATDDGRTCD